MAEDVSKNVVLFLLIIAVVVAIIGQFFVVSEASDVSSQISGGSSTANVVFESEDVHTTGSVQLTILKNEQGGDQN